MIRYRLNIYYFDWLSFCITFTLSFIGLFFILSATFQFDQHYSIFFKKQLYGIIAGFAIYITACNIETRHIMRYGYFGYFILIGLLCWTMLKGTIGLGAQRWLSIAGIIKLQPSELCKLLLPAFMSYYFYSLDEQKDFGWHIYLPTVGMLLLSFVLVLKQPDLGTALIILSSGVCLLAYAGLAKHWFLLAALGGTILMPLSWHLLKPYQQHRVLVFFGHGEAQKERYQIEQAKIAIGSGGLYGKGYKQGTQNILQFLPESRTDFIFAVVAEEWGFFGACLIALLYLILAFRLCTISSAMQDQWISLLALGMSIHITLSACINMAMVVGLLPIVGIPLPLMSYGLSNLWVVLASLGLCNGMSMRHFEMNP